MLLRLTLAAGVALSLLLAFLVVRTGDEAAPRGTSVGITIWDLGDDLTLAESETLVEAAARNLNVTLDRVVLTDRGGRTLRTVTVVTTSSSSPILRPGSPYPDFGRSVVTRLDQHGDRWQGSVTGSYATSADPSTVQDFVDRLRAHGMIVTTRAFSPVEILLWTAEVAPLVQLIVATVLILVLGCATATLSRRREDALLIVHGARRWRVIGRHLARSVLTTLAFGAAALAIAIPLLAAYNGLAQFATFAQAAGVGVAFVAVTAGAIVTATASLTSPSRPLPAIEGKRPLTRLMLLGFVTHALAFGLVVIVFATVAHVAIPLESNRRDAARWSAAGELSALTFRTSNHEFDEAQADIASLARVPVETGVALLSVFQRRSEPLPDEAEGNTLLVNERFLDASHIVDATGRRVRSSSLRPGVLTLLVPVDRLSEKAALVREYRDLLRLQSSEDAALGRLDDIPVAVVATRSGQRIFDYTTKWPTSTQINPVVAVIPKGRPVLSQDWLASEMTSGGILFPDAERLRADVRSRGLAGMATVVSAKDLAASREAEQARAVVTHGVAGGIGFGAVVLCAVIFASSIADRNRRRDLLRMVHGGSRASAILGPLASIGLSDAAAVALAAAAGLLPTVPWLTAVIGLGVVDLLLVGTLLGAQQRRLRADTIKKS